MSHKIPSSLFFARYNFPSLYPKGLLTQLTVLNEWVLGVMFIIYQLLGHEPTTYLRITIFCHEPPTYLRITIFCHEPTTYLLITIFCHEPTNYLRITIFCHEPTAYLRITIFCHEPQTYLRITIKQKQTELLKTKTNKHQIR